MKIGFLHLLTSDEFCIRKTFHVFAMSNLDFEFSFHLDVIEAREEVIGKTFIYFCECYGSKFQFC